MTRVCIKCRVEKAEAEFALNKYGNKYFRRRVCRVCYNAARPDHLGDVKPEGRICKKCGMYKPITGFPIQRQCLYGVEPICKACKAARRQEYIRLHPERARNADLKYQYGITLEDYAAMLERQQGQCAICGTADEKLVVDHNHITGKVRSLLCHLCNALIGCAREDIAILVRAAAYLHAEQHPELGSVRAEVAFVAAVAVGA